MKRARLLLAGIFGTLLALGGIFAMSTPAAALFEGAQDQACNGANLTDGGGCSGAADQSGKVDETLATVINILSSVVGIIAVIMIIIGGIRFVTSQGDGSSTAAARNTIIYALIGLAVAAMGQVIVKFVINRTVNGTPPAVVAPVTTPAVPTTVAPASITSRQECVSNGYIWHDEIGPGNTPVNVCTAPSNPVVPSSLTTKQACLGNHYTWHDEIGPGNRPLNVCTN